MLAPPRYWGEAIKPASLRGAGQSHLAKKLLPFSSSVIFPSGSREIQRPQKTPSTRPWISPLARGL